MLFELYMRLNFAMIFGSFHQGKEHKNTRIEFIVYQSPALGGNLNPQGIANKNS